MTGASRVVGGAGGARRAGAGAGHRNEVRLRGRLAAPPELRELPSGDVLCSWRLVVERPEEPAPREGARRVRVDALDCATWDEQVREQALALEPGALVALEGALRRRFWRAGAGPASRTEVEVRSLRPVARAAPVRPPAPQSSSS